MLVYLAMIDSPDDRHKFEVIYNTYKQLMYYIANNTSLDNGKHTIE